MGILKMQEDNNYWFIIILIRMTDNEIQEFMTALLN